MQQTSDECLDWILKLKAQLKDYCKQKHGRIKKLAVILKFKSVSYVYTWFGTRSIPRGETLYGILKFVGHDPQLMLEVNAAKLKEKDERERQEEEEEKKKRRRSPNPYDRRTYEI
jgi:hypothetical protein